MKLSRYKKLKRKFVLDFISDMGKYKSKRLFKTIRNYSIIFLLIVEIFINMKKSFIEIFSVNHLIIVYIASLSLAMLAYGMYRILVVIKYFKRSSKQKVNSDFIKSVTIHAVGYRKKNKITIDEYLFILDNMRW